MDVRAHLPLIGLLMVPLVLGLGVLSREDDPDRLRFAVEGDRAYGNGYTTSRSAGVVSRLVRDHPEVTTLVFERMSGTRDMVTNQGIARDIRRAGLSTELSADSFIASGAVDLFIAGVERRAACGARVGVHAWGMGDAFDARDAGWDNMRGFARAYLSDMGIAPDFYDYTVRMAPADGLHIMRPDELERWGLVTQDMNCAPEG